jgi:hypothetical protein
MGKLKDGTVYNHIAAALQDSKGQYWILDPKGAAGPVRIQEWTAALSKKLGREGITAIYEQGIGYGFPKDWTAKQVTDAIIHGLEGNTEALGQRVWRDVQVWTSDMLKGQLEVYKPPQ